MSRHPRARVLRFFTAMCFAAVALGLSAGAAQEKPSPQPADNEVLEPRWRFAPGQPFYQEVSTVAKTTVTFMGKPMEGSQSGTFWSQYTPIQKRDRTARTAPGNGRKNFCTRTDCGGQS